MFQALCDVFFLHDLNYSSQQPNLVGFSRLILLMRKLRFVLMKQFAQIHPELGND